MCNIDIKALQNSSKHIENYQPVICTRFNVLEMDGTSRHVKLGAIVVLGLCIVSFLVGFGTNFWTQTKYAWHGVFTIHSGIWRICGKGTFLKTECYDIDFPLLTEFIHGFSAQACKCNLLICIVEGNKGKLWAQLRSKLCDKRKK